MIKRLWIVTNSLSAGGGQIFAYREARHFASLGYEVVYICLFGILDKVGRSMYRELCENNIKVCLGEKSIKGQIRLFIQIFTMKTPQIAHSHLDHSDIFIKFFRSVRIANFQIVRTLHTEKFSPNLRLFHKFMLKGYINISCSTSILFPQIKIHAVIPNGVPKYNAQYRIFNERLNIVVVGNFNSVHGLYVKNQEFIIQELSRCQIPYKVTFIGDGENRAYCETLANRLNVISEFVGNVYNVVELLMSAQLLVSASMFEGSPLSILEAKSTGLPLLLSSIDAHKQFKCDEYFDLTKNSLAESLEKYYLKNKGKKVISYPKDLRFQEEVFKDYEKIFQKI